MKVSLLVEPELEFGGLGRHIDIKFGIMDYGPFDYGSTVAPREIKVGVIGTPETIEGVTIWFERCRGEITAKKSKQPHLFPRFPGFNPDNGFRATLLIEGRLQRTIQERVFDRLAKTSELAWLVREAVQVFCDELEHLAEDTRPDIVICAVPMSLLNALERDYSKGEGADDERDDDEREAALDFHHFLKARAMSLGMPIQIILPMTYDETKRRQQKGQADRIRRLQDEATRAWNIHTALYYKAGGVPWRLVRDASDLTACHVGISFYKALDGSSLLTSMAQVFNQRGDGVIVRGGKAKISKDDRQAHLDEEDARLLLDHALRTYKAEHKTLPARVVLHKSSSYSNGELVGFIDAIEQRDIESLDCMSIRKGFTRLFRTAAYPPLRCTLFDLDDKHHILYTRGSVDFFTTYPGMYVPRPLEIRCERTEQTATFLAQEILALTKMNWNNTQFDGGDPITLRAARQVANILKYLGEDERVHPRYSFYM